MGQGDCLDLLGFRTVFKWGLRLPETGRRELPSGLGTNFSGALEFKEGLSKKGRFIHLVEMVQYVLIFETLKIINLIS